MKTRVSLLLVVLVTGIVSFAQTSENFFKAAGTPVDPKVNLSWNRYNDSEGINAIIMKLAVAHPGLIKTEVIGQSFQGKDLILMTVTDFSKGKPDDKPGFYIDGNIHSNEIQGAEVSLYTAWYLAESFADTQFIQELLSDKVFYILPSINPDARDNYMKEGNTPHSPRAGMMPIDDDRDGLQDEDGYDDLDGDGHITTMWRKNPNGRWKKDPNDDRFMIRVKADELGEYERLGSEGIDNDGDGQVNEDRVGGYYDPNRDWGWSWQPNHIQGGAYKYPFSVPENRAVMNFAMKHPNIAGAQSYHNYGGMLLRGPGAEEDAEIYDDNDKRVYDVIGKLGAKILPGYRYMVVYKDLYSVFGGELDWFHGGRGVFTFTNELYTSFMMFNDKESHDDDRSIFDKRLLMQDGFVPLKEYDHPVYGKIEIGGPKKNYGRADPGFLLESDAHRNMAFTIYHAYQTPKLVIEDVEEKSLGGGLTQITATIANKRLIPTHSSHDIKNKIERPDYISIKGANVISGMRVINKDLNLTTEQIYTPEQIEMDNIPGMSTVTVRWLVSGKGKYTIEVNSAKGGKVNQ